MTKSQTEGKKDYSKEFTDQDVVYMCETILAYLDMGMVDRAKQHLENLQRWFIYLPTEGELLKVKQSSEGKGIKDKWFIYIRINKYQIRQFHLAKRLLSENEIKRVPNKWWVSEQFVRKNYFYQDILKQYKLRGNL